MKKLSLLLSFCILVWFSFAVTNITDEDLEWILTEVNGEIEKEIKIISISEETQSVKDDNTCGIDTKEKCEDEIDLAVKKLNEIWATIFSTSKDFMVSKNIRRDEAAKMFLKFAKWAKLEVSKKSWVSCSFSDLGKAWKDIVPMIWEVCEYGWFKWSKWKFMPLDNITNWQAVIVLVRLIDGKKEEEEWVSHYAENYMKKAEELWLLKDLWIKDISMRDKPAKRWLVAKLLYRSLNLQK